MSSRALILGLASLVSTLLLAAVTPPLAAQVSPPFLVDDVSQYLAPERSIDRIERLTDVVIFTAPGRIGRSDGTFEGTETLASFDFETPRVVAVTPDRERLYFAADGGLWVTDGSRGGTLRLTTDADPARFTDPLFHSGTGDLYFVTPDFDARELWRSDGTPGGTVRLFSGESVGLGAEVDGGILFLAARGADGPELWRTDGTRQSTRPLTNLNASAETDIGLHSLTAVGDRAVFVVKTPDFDESVWSTDGTPEGTTPVWAGTVGAGQVSRVLAGDTVAYALVFDVLPEESLRLLRTDGTPEGTREIASFEHFQLLATLGDGLLFSVFGEDTGFEPWVSDGTVEGTHLLADVCPGPCWPLTGVVAVADTVIYLSMTDGVTGHELWVTDLDDVHLVGDVCAGPCSSTPRAADLHGDRLVFFADGDRHGEELYLTTPTGPITRLTDLEPLHPFPSYAAALLGDRLFFGTADARGATLERVLVVPGEGPQRARRLLALPATFHDTASFPNGFSHRGDTLYFAAYESPYRLSLYRRSPRGPGERLAVLSDRTRDDRGRLDLQATYTAVVDGGVFANAPNGGNNRRLVYVEDAPDAAPRLLVESDDLFTPLYPTGDGVFFLRGDGPNLWFSDGTVDGTRVVAEGLSQGGNLVAVFGGFAYFATPDGFGVTDGTVEGTRTFLDLTDEGLRGGSVFATETHLFLEARSDSASRLSVLDGATGDITPIAAPGLEFVVEWVAGRDGAAYLTVGPDYTDTRLWHVSAEPARAVDLGMPFYPYYGAFRFDGIQVGFVDGVLHVVRSDGVVVRSDGTPEGTAPSTLLPASPRHTGALAELPDGRVLYVQAVENDQEGAFRRFWVTDGTAGGTRSTGVLDLVEDELEVAGNRVYFAGAEFEPGAPVDIELWAVSLSTTRETMLPVAPRICDPDRGELCL